MGNTITLTAADDHKLSAYRVSPEPASNFGLVVVQEIFGVNSHIRKVTDDFAARGFNALAPALFDRVAPNIELGYESADVEKGRDIRAKISMEAALHDVDAAIRHLRGEGLAVGVVGYCWGGSLAWAAVTRLEGVACSVGYYGGMVPDMANEQPRSPVMLHFGEQDQSIPLEGVEKVRAAHPDVPLYIYQAGHGFSCDARGSYDQASAELALERTLEFLQTHLGKAAA